MNQFSNLSAESEVSALATVSPCEVFADETPANVRAVRGVNVAKLVKHNLGKPLSSRVNHAALSAKVAFARKRGELIAFWARIHAEVEPARVELRRREALLDASTCGN